jgi:dihydroorotate dehydrogenase
VILNGIDFGPIWGASGVQGFFGEGYPIHRRWGPLGPRFDGMTFVAKTTTLHERAGNMPLRVDHTPKELLPRCVVVNFWRAVAVNAVGLSGPGAETLITTRRPDRWQERMDPFFISFMSVAGTVEERLTELQGFTHLLLARSLGGFRASVGLQWNLSCPNVGVHHDNLVEEAHAGFDIVSSLGIPIVAKLFLATPPETARQIAAHPACSGICITNTIPWGQLAELDIDPKRYFRSSVSPLILRGFEQAGGFSGAPLLPLVSKWVREARLARIEKHINAGGGIMKLTDVDVLKNAGADSVFIGTMAMLRPWRVQATIRRAHRLFRHG